jgi:hypothetical protein
MKYNQFEKYINCLKEFFDEQEKLDNVLKVIAPSGTSVCEFGNKFVDDYIDLMENALNDDAHWISWFVFDNNFGNKKLTIMIGNNYHKISSTKKFYDVVIKDLKK